MSLTDHFFLLYFFPMFLLLYLPFRKNILIGNLIIIAGSLLFYASYGKEYLPALIIPYAINFLLVLGIKRARNKKTRKILLAVAILIDIILLSYYKYYNFFLSSIAFVVPYEVYNFLTSYKPLLAPIGISFIVFQRISYTVDVYRNIISPSKNIIQYSVYATLFPHLISGPIIRFKDIRDEVKKRIVSNAMLFDGFKFFIVGIFLKVVLADKLVPVIDILKTNITTNNVIDTLILIFYFSYRLYLDFAGYSLMAIGLAKFMGFNFPYNFNSPYRASSFRDFWRKWNITLSLWFRDYLYIPLGGSRKGQTRRSINLMITMLLVGLWHGANWNFILWGGVHGALQTIEHGFRERGISVNLPIFVKQVFIFFVISLLWITFLFTTPQEIMYAFKSLVIFDGKIFHNTNTHALILSLPAFIGAFIWATFLNEKYVEKIKVSFLSSLTLIIVFVFILVMIFNSGGVPFFYFQF